jgi:hypothetical protein
MRPRPSDERAYLGRRTLRCKYTATFFYAPFAVGAALIWAVPWGVKRKIADVLRALGMTPEDRRTYCIFLARQPAPHQYVE